MLGRGAVFEEAAFYINDLSYTKLTCATGFLAFKIALEGKTLMVKQLMWWFSIEDLSWILSSSADTRIHNTHTSY